MGSSRSHPKYENITQRWGGMDIRHEFSTRIDQWLGLFPETDHPLLLNLLGHFYFYSEKNIKNGAKALYEKFRASFPQESEVVYIPAIKQYGVGFSSIYFDNFWHVNNLYDEAEPGILELLNHDVVPTVLAIVDDYSGTGETISKTIEKLISANDKVEKSRVYILVQHITKRAEQYLSTVAQTLNLDIRIVFVDYSEETFKPDYLFEYIEAEKQRRNYSDICDRLSVEENDRFGFEEVQSLVAFHYNTPNDTLGLFWKDLDGFVALFPRYKKRKTSLRELQNKAKQQDQLRKAKPVIYGFDDRRVSAFLAYCVAQGNGFSFSQAMEQFGLTQSQMHTIIDKLVDEGYITCEEGLFKATQKTKEVTFHTRMREMSKAFKKDYKENQKSFIRQDTSYIPLDF